MSELNIACKDIKDYRDKHGCSLMEAKRVVVDIPETEGDLAESIQDAVRHLNGIAGTPEGYGNGTVECFVHDIINAAVLAIKLQELKRLGEHDGEYMFGSEF